MIMTRKFPPIDKSIIYIANLLIFQYKVCAEVYFLTGVIRMKKCSKCNKNKYLYEFPIRKDSPDGHRSECKDCKSKYLKEYRINPPIKEICPKGYKRCCGCQKLLTLDNFHKHARSPDGYKARCKDCRNIENAKHRESNPEYYKKWQQEHQEERKIYAKEYCKNNKDKIAIQKKEYYSNNPNKKEEMKKYKKNWYEVNKDKIMKNKKERYHNDLYFKIAYKLRNRFTNAIRNNCKKGSAIKDLGCSIEEFKKYIENRFQSGMNWQNYGQWHIDHIIPLFNFDLTDREQVKKACHYTNLQPLWAEDNLKKSAKMPF